MVHYIGLDVSLKQTSICVVNQVGSVVREGVVGSDPEAIAAFVRSKAPGAVRIGLETGPTATWLWTELKQLGLPVICIDARHARAVLKMQIRATDRHLDRKVLKLARYDAQVRRFMTVPGVGPITALCFKATIDDPTRFKRSRSVGAYVGLTTRRHASGEIDWTGGISKCGDAMLRSYLFEAAGVLLTRVPKWSALKAWGMRLAKRGGLRKAAVAVARKLAVILHRMWIDRTEFNWSKKEVAA
jgi:transposase